MAPFILGSALALLLYPRLSTSNVPFTSFALFMGVAMSITAFPVLARLLSERMKDPVTILLLPAFFALAGMRTRIDLGAGASGWLVCALIVVVATAGTFGGTLIAARLSGMGLDSAAAPGVLMNTRGLVELIVLNVGLNLGVISPALFTMLVLMALATTMATTPALDLLVPNFVGYNRTA